jgi:hypothetical protein
MVTVTLNVDGGCHGNVDSDDVSVDNVDDGNIEVV